MASRRPASPPTSDEALEPALAFLRELWSLNHALEKTSKRMQRRLGVTAQQRMVLRFVGKYPGIAPGQLAKILHVDAGTLTTALKRLEERRFVVRRADAVDKRRSMLELTARGRRLDTPTSGPVEAAVERVLEASTATEIRKTSAFLQRLVEHLHTS